MTASLVGEDRSDWLRGEEHEASEWFARYLLSRDAAILVKGEVPPVPPVLTTHAVIADDPVAEHRDPIGPRKKR